MDVAVIGSGFIGGTLGRALARSGHAVTFGSRHPESDDVSQGTGAETASVGGDLAAAPVAILAVPALAVPDLVAEHGDALAGKLVIDSTNRAGDAVANSRSVLPSSVRYARAFSTLGGENMADPIFEDGPADMFFSASDDDRAVVEDVIAGVGLRPVFVGPDQEGLVDCLFRLWIALAVTQGRGRRLAFRLLEGPR
jgi:8-hydroxy-5-deazaflavin:NADPH oxidoreductase